MLKQFSYSLKTRIPLRLTAGILMIVLNIIFTVCGVTGIYGNAGKITAVTFSSLAFCAWLVVCVLADSEMIKSLFSAPKGYYVFLTPVSSRKILMGRLAAILVWDIPGFIIGVIGIIVQAFLLARIPLSTLINNNKIDSWEVLSIFLMISQLALFFTTIFFMAALTKSIFFSKKARTLSGILGGLLAVYAMSWFDLILIPFASVQRHGILIQISIPSGDYLATGIFLVLTLLKTAVLFYITSYLMERKINI